MYFVSDFDTMQEISTKEVSSIIPLIKLDN